MFDKDYLLELAKIYGIEVRENETIHLIKEDGNVRELETGDIFDIACLNTQNFDMFSNITLNAKFELSFDTELLGVG